MESHIMNYPSPRGVHVSETFASNDHDSYHPPRRNRYSRSTQQTPRIREDVTWISSSLEPTPQTPRAPPSPWLPPQQAPSSPYRPASAAPPSPAPTVGEHMALDELEFEMVDPYPPQPKRGLLRSFWHGLKKLSGHQYQPSYSSRRGSYQSQAMQMPAPLSTGSEGTQYVDPSPTDEQPGSAPYSSPYTRPSQLGGPSMPSSRRASPVPSMKIPSPLQSPVPMPSVTSPRARKPSATPATLRSALRAPSPVSSVGAPPIRIVSPSIPPSPRPSSRRSVRAAQTPAIPILRSPPSGSEPSVAFMEPTDQGSHTLHEAMPTPVLPRLDTQLPMPAPAPAPAVIFAAPRGAPAEPKSPDGSLASSIASVRRFFAGIDNLPWTDAQIADEYVPAENPRSRMRRQVRQGAKPSWYNPRAEMIGRRPYLSEWDMWAMQATAGMWDGKGTAVTRPGEWGVMYPRGYVGMAPR